VARAEERTGVRGTIKTSIAGRGAAVLDRELIATALAELLVNAVQASNGGESAPQVELEVQIGRADGRLLILVRDRGTGMSPRALQHAFDPFFSEKPAGRQTGLGLTRARRLVELHSGEISLRSVPGQGTVATIALPAGEGPRVQVPHQATSQPRPAAA
jgi:signal transduction histidine kinase